MQKLTNIKINNTKPTNRTQKFGDGNGLVFVQKPNGSKLFHFNFRLDNRQRTISFGEYPEVSLEKAREMARETKALVKKGVDPTIHKKQKNIEATKARLETFEAVARDWYKIKTAQYTEGHRKRCLRMLEIHLFPEFGDIPLDQLTTPMILAALRKIEEQGKFETAHRAKQVADQTLRYANQIGLIERNVAQYLTGALRSPDTQHFAAITDPKQLGSFLRAIDGYSGGLSVRTGLALTPHLLLRPGELRKLEWTDINWEKRIISIPNHRMKTREHHIVPLSRQVLELLTELKPFSGYGPYVFSPPARFDRCLSDNAIRSAIRAIGYDKNTVTPHGFRATARTLLDEELGFNIAWIEHQLAHAVIDTNGRAYNRTTHLDNRRVMMQRWSDYLDELKNSVDK
ncbi:MAG: tyrosine-type recombinase/integrase [Oleiphilus sp.]